MVYKEMLSQWLLNSDDATVAELSALSEAELEERFYKELEFGTAGLRGIMGAGTNRMNLYVLRRATKGLADYLASIKGAKTRGVVIAYDSRLNSDVFARETALVLANNGIRAYLFESLRSVPQLSFSVQKLGCIAGIVITASHNPSEYNGYKVYWEHGGQLGPIQAEEVFSRICAVGYFGVAAMSKAEALEKGLLTIVGKELDEAYYAATASLMLEPALVLEHGSALKVVYTPLHGAGKVPVVELLSRVGVSNVHVVIEQAEPNSAFPTVKAPNPEEVDAYALSISLAKKLDADLILATDPDADRLGLAVRGHDGSFFLLTGNQIGCLLLHYMLSTLHAKGRLPKNGLVVKSIVSTPLADAICARYLVRLESVLTGFRFISEKVDYCASTRECSFLFGFEESYGFLAGGFSRDKDAICASMLLAEAALVYSLKGMTLADALDELDTLYGCYRERVISYTLEGKSGMERIKQAMASLRETPIQSLAGLKTDFYEDYYDCRRIHVLKGFIEHIELPNAEMVRFVLEGGAFVIVRPSGTEPKLKLYVGVNAAKKEQADAFVELVATKAKELVDNLLA